MKVKDENIIIICICIILIALMMLIAYIMQPKKSEAASPTVTTTSQTTTTETTTTTTTSQTTTTTRKTTRTTTQKVETASYNDYQIYASEYGSYDETQMNCLINLWNRESGWDPNAVNRSSGACGIPQALPCSKIANSEGDNTWQSQIRWGVKYINNRYGSPCAAWEHFQNKNWY